MTKLMEWLLSGFVAGGLWLAIILGNLHTSLDIKLQHTILWLPMIALFLFGLYALIVVLYRTFTFNNCESAATELREQIKEAVADLEKKGFKVKKSN